MTMGSLSVPLSDIFVLMVIVVVFLLIGYAMGRNSSEKTLRAGGAPLLKKTGDDDTGKGDIFNECMYPDEADKRVPTLEGG